MDNRLWDEYIGGDKNYPPVWVDKEGGYPMGVAIDYEKVMTEIVFINLPGPREPSPGMTGTELLHGFLADLYTAADPEVKHFINTLCLKWNIHYRQKSG